MIGRGSARAIADAYNEMFTGTRYVSRGRTFGSSRTYGGSDRKFIYYSDTLHDFLYVNDFGGWILNSVKAVSEHKPRALLEFIMRLHTGESCMSATADWSWDARRALGQRVLRDLAESLLRERYSGSWSHASDHSKTSAITAMQRQLELDGYVFQSGVLLVPEESVLDESEEQGVLSELVIAVGLSDSDTVHHHLRLSEEHYRAGRWDDSISNSRKVLEAVLQQAALEYAKHPGAAGIASGDLDRPVRVRDYLESVGLLDHKEKAAVAATYGLLSDTGGHPNIAQQDQARLMRHLALTFSQFVLLRLKGAGAQR